MGRTGFSAGGGVCARRHAPATLAGLLQNTALILVVWQANCFVPISTLRSRSSGFVSILISARRQRILLAVLLKRAKQFGRGAFARRKSPIGFRRRGPV